MYIHQFVRVMFTDVPTCIVSPELQVLSPDSAWSDLQGHIAFVIGIALVWQQLQETVRSDSELCSFWIFPQFVMALLGHIL